VWGGSLLAKRNCFVTVCDAYVEEERALDLFQILRQVQVTVCEATQWNERTPDRNFAECMSHSL